MAYVLGSLLDPPVPYVHLAGVYPRQDFTTTPDPVSLFFSNAQPKHVGSVASLPQTLFLAHLYPKRIATTPPDPPSLFFARVYPRRGVTPFVVDTPAVRHCTLAGYDTVLARWVTWDTTGPFTVSSYASPGDIAAGSFSIIRDYFV